MSIGVSVIIPSFNEEKFIGKCIESIVRTDYSKELLEIIIVDGLSTDKTRDIINKYSQSCSYISLLDNPKHITPVALNLGIRNSRYNYVLVASAHSVFPKRYITELMNNLISLNADVVGGQLITRVLNKNMKSESIAKVLSSRMGVGNSVFRIGTDIPKLVDTVPFGLYKKELFYKVGFYNERLVRNHDIELSKRLLRSNCKIFLIPSASCVYYARDTYRSLAKNNFENGLWNILTFYITKKADSLSKRHYVPLLFLLSLILPIVPSIILHGFFIFLTLLSLVLYMIMIIISSLKKLDNSSKFINIFWGFIVLHFSYGAGSMIGLFKVKRLFMHASQ